MPHYLFACHGVHTPESEAEDSKVMGAWMAWFGGMGMRSCNSTTGCSVVSADTTKAACELARGCPMPGSGNGSMDVAEGVEGGNPGGDAPDPMRGLIAGAALRDPTGPRPA